VPALALSLAVALLSTVDGGASAATAAGATAHRSGSTGRVAVPAVLSGDGLRARLPSGGTVSYDLPPAPDGGTRLLGDWNGDGTQTPGYFLAGSWQLFSQVMRGGSGSAVTFGQAGDLPVVGDWNGDGTTDLGVVRGDHWLLALGPFAKDAAPTVWKDVSFPGAGTPVSGDWDGNGAAGIGWYADGSWTLADSLDSPATTTTASYGVPGDTPVVGDWNGDGRDGIGTVRGADWHLSNSISSPRRSYLLTLPHTAGEVPTVWEVPGTPTTTTCPTARNRRAGQPGWVVPSTALTSTRPKAMGRTAGAVRGSLLQTQRYLLGAQYASLWKATRNAPYLDLVGRAANDELSIRLPAMSALTVAVGLSTGAYDPTVVGVRRPAAYRYVDQLVRSIACSHVSVSPGGWGNGWETAYWAAQAGAAAWLVWGRLTPQTQADVTSMVVSEADRLSTQKVPYWALPDGTVTSPGDTKAEENAWNATLLDLAAVMMPRAPHATAWRAEAAELAVAAYSVKADVTSTAKVNGVPLAERLQGFNAYPDGTVENHHRIHPDYAANIQLLWTAADFDRLAGRRALQALFHNAGLVYGAFSTKVYVAGAPSPAGGTYAAPGGTVFRPGHSTIYYPQGDDWGTARRAHFVSLDAHADVYARYLEAAGWPAPQALTWHERGQQRLVAASGAHDGRTYSIDPAIAAQQDTYPGREEYAASSLATAWLALYVGHLGVPRLDRGRLDVPVSTSKAPTAPTSRHLAP
jgi:hypothetical protein